MFEADDELRGRHIRSFVELPLKHGATLQAGLLRVGALTFAKSQLIGDIGGQISKSGKYNRELWTESEVARAAELVIKPEARLWDARVRRAVTESAEVCILDHVRHRR